MGLVGSDEITGSVAVGNGRTVCQPGQVQDVQVPKVEMTINDGKHNRVSLGCNRFLLRISLAAFKAIPCDVEEARNEEQVACCRVGHIGDAAHEERHNSATDNAHDDDTRSSLDQILRQVDDTQRENRREADGHKEEYGNEEEYARAARNDIEEDDEDGVDEGVRTENLAGTEFLHERRRDDTANEEGYEGNAKEIGCTAVAQTLPMFDAVVDKEGAGTDLGSNVEELRQGTETEMLVAKELAVRAVPFSSIFIAGNVRPFRQLVDDEENEHDEDDSRNTDVYHLDIVHVAVNIGTAGNRQEEHTADNRSQELANAVGTLGNVQAEGCVLVAAQLGNVRVGVRFQAGQAASDDKECYEENVETVGIARRNDHESANSVERQAHHDAALIAVFAGYERSRRSEDEIAAEIRCLQEAGRGFRNAELILEILVHDVDQAIAQAPEEKQGRDQDEGNLNTFTAGTWHNNYLLTLR